MAKRREEILVIGATGTLGREVVHQLLERGARVRAASRDPHRAAAVLSGVDGVVELDFERPATFAAALSGVERVLLMARPGDDESDRVAIPLIDEMRRQGARHVVNLTAMGVERLPATSLHRVERCLEGSGLAYTHLRPNFFMQIFSGGALRAAIQASSIIAVPAADARLSFVDVRDIAAVAAVALTTDDHLGRAYTLTGGEALDHTAVARALSAAVGREIHYHSLSEEEASSSLAAAGLPRQRIDRLLGFYRLVRGGACAPISEDVQKVLGRPPIPFSQFAADYEARWSAAR